MPRFLVLERILSLLSEVNELSGKRQPQEVKETAKSYENYCVVVDLRTPRTSRLKREGCAAKLHENL